MIDIEPCLMLRKEYFYWIWKYDDRIIKWQYQWIYGVPLHGCPLKQCEPVFSWCVTVDKYWEWSQTGRRTGKCQGFWGNRRPSPAHWYWDSLLQYWWQRCLWRGKNFPKMFPHLQHCHPLPPEAKSLVHKGPLCSGVLGHKRFPVGLQHLGIWKERTREKVGSGNIFNF